MKRTVRRILSAALLLVTCCGTSDAADVAEFLNFSLPTLPGRLYVPPEAASGPRPLILFMHGVGEIGTDNTRQVNFEIDTLFAQAKARGAFLYAPQSPAGGWGVNRTTDIMSMIDQAIAGFNIDTDRLYATGLSMGGGGVWNVLNRHGERFAAAVPTAAITPEGDFLPENLVGKPIWAFHARNDDVVTVLSSQFVMGEVLNTAGLDQLLYPPSVDRRQTLLYEHEQLSLKYTELPTGGHSIWHDVYARSDVHDWMFAQSLGAPTGETPAPNGQVHVDGGVTGGGPQVVLRNAAGVAVNSGSGFAALGAFDLDDATLANANASTLAGIADSFVRFGPPSLLGGNSPGGLFDNTGLGGGLPGGLLGNAIYLVFGDGDSITDSNSLGIVKFDQAFQEVADGVVSLRIEVTEAGGPLTGGQVLLGDLTSESSPRYGVRGYINAADVTVPEPHALGLAALVALPLITRRRSPRLVAAG